MGNTESSPKGGKGPHPPTLPHSSTQKFRTIRDNFRTVEDVQDALRQQGLESSQLIIAVDFTKSNEWTGKHSFGNRSLHSIGNTPNPYEEAIIAIGRTLQSFDDDGLIQAYGFGDGTTGDRHVFSFHPDDRPCDSLDSVVWRYRELAPYVRLAGPTSFAPAIRQAVEVVAKNDGAYHILIIIADGQVTRGCDLHAHERSAQEQDTVDAIVAASKYPLSIVLVGVGDGPFDLMKEFDDKLPQREFDNFQFVNFTELAAASYSDPRHREAAFALRALMEVPEQYRAIQHLHLLNKRGLPQLGCIARPPPGPPSSLPASAPPPQRHPPPPTPQVNQMFICPITQDIMRDPVIAADGYTYERHAIEQWLQSHSSSPLSNAPLPARTLIPNHNLRSTIMETHPGLV